MIGDYSCMYTYPLKAGSNEGNIALSYLSESYGKFNLV